MLINSSYFTFFKLKKKILWHFEGEKIEWFGYISKEEEEKILPWMVSSAKKKEKEKEKFILFLLASFVLIVLDFFIHSFNHSLWISFEWVWCMASNCKKQKMKSYSHTKKIYSYFPVP